MIKLVLILSMLSFWDQPPLQTEGQLSGIYIMVTPQRKVPCGNEAKMIVNNQKICISKKPIIAASQLTYATDIQYDPTYQMHYIDIGLSPAGSSILSQTIESLPDTQFALALNDQVICVFKMNQSFTIRSFRIGADIQLKDLTAIHEVLKDVKFN
jgi:preprotein translocase subunit SecD